MWRQLRQGMRVTSADGGRDTFAMRSCIISKRSSGIRYQKISTDHLSANRGAEHDLLGGKLPQLGTWASAFRWHSERASVLKSAKRLLGRSPLSNIPLHLGRDDRDRGAKRCWRHRDRRTPWPCGGLRHCGVRAHMQWRPYALPTTTSAPVSTMTAAMWRESHDKPRRRAMCGRHSRGVHTREALNKKMCALAHVDYKPHCSTITGLASPICAHGPDERARRRLR